MIELVASEWASPVVFVPKSDISLRFCLEYHILNQATVEYTYPLPRMDDFIDILGDAVVFSTLNENFG